MPKYYPMMMNLQDRKCLVVGGGEVAARKTESLVNCGAKPTVVAPEMDPDILALEKEGKVTALKEKYRPDHMEGAVLVIASTDHEDVNRAVYNDATERGIPVNVVDVPPLCSFIVPSIVEQGDLLLAISTSGRSPAFSKRIRKKLEKEFGPEYARMLAFMGRAREELMTMEEDVSARMKILSELANSDVFDRITAGEDPNPMEELKRCGAR